MRGHAHARIRPNTRGKNSDPQRSRVYTQTHAQTQTGLTLHVFGTTKKQKSIIKLEYSES